MADDQKNIDKEISGTNQEEITTQENGKKGSKNGKIFLLTGMLAVEIILGFFLIKNFYPSIHELLSGFTASNPVYYPIEEIIINPANTDGSRYLLLSIAIQVENEGVSAKLKEKHAIVIDDINTLLSRYSTDELNSIEKRELIKKELAIMINKTLEENSVQDLFFTKYVMQ